MTYQYPEYTPIKSMSRELGTLFGFLAACLVTMILYAVVWQAIQKTNTKKDKARREQLRARGFPHSVKYKQSGLGGIGNGIPEKMTDRDPLYVGRAELPAQGKIVEMGAGVGVGESSAGDGQRLGQGQGQRGD